MSYVDNRTTEDVHSYNESAIDALRRCVKEQEKELRQLRYDMRILRDENLELQNELEQLRKPRP
jgi:uncharacterized coiled-coil protein SlyX